MATATATAPEVKAINLGGITKVPCKDIVVKGRHRKDLGDLKGLGESMTQLGQLNPIILNKDHQLIAGERRLEAAKLLGWETIESRVCKTAAELTTALLAERDENKQRQPFKGEEALSVANAYKAAIAAAGGNPNSKKASKAAAAAAGVSPETARKLGKLKTAADKGDATARAALDKANKTGRIPQKTYVAVTKAAAKPEANRDRAGHELDTKEAKQVVLEDYYDEAIRLLKSAQRVVNDIAQEPAGRPLLSYLKAVTRQNDVIYHFAAVAEIIATLEKHNPYSLCAACLEKNGHPHKYSNDCPDCRGGGFVGKTVYEKQGEDARKKLKKATNWKEPAKK